MKGMTVDLVQSRFANKVPFDSLTLVGEGVPEITEATPKRPAVEIISGNLPNTIKAILVDGWRSPAAFLAPGNAGRDWPMASGSFIWTSDSRFGDIIRARLGIEWDLATDEPLKHAVVGPVSLHNRYEIKPEPFGLGHYLENAAQSYHETGDITMKQLREALYDIASDKATYGEIVSLVCNLAQALIQSDYYDDMPISCPVGS